MMSLKPRYPPTLLQRYTRLLALSGEQLGPHERDTADDRRDRHDHRGQQPARLACESSRNAAFGRIRSRRAAHHPLARPLALPRMPFAPLTQTCQLFRHRGLDGCVRVRRRTRARQVALRLGVAAELCVRLADAVERFRLLAREIEHLWRWRWLRQGSGRRRACVRARVRACVSTLFACAIAASSRPVRSFVAARLSCTWSARAGSSTSSLTHRCTAESITLVGWGAGDGLRVTGC